MDLGMVTSSAITTVLAGGVTASMNTCVDWAIDGYLVTGISTLYEFYETGGPTFAVVVAQATAYALYVDRYAAIYPTLPSGHAAGKYVN